MKLQVLIIFLCFPIFINGQSISSDSIRTGLYDLRINWANEQIQMMPPSQEKFELSALESFLKLMVMQSKTNYDRFLEETETLSKDNKRKYGDKSFISSQFNFHLHLYRAIGSLQFEEYTRAAKDLLKAHKSYERMLDIHPAHPLSSMAKGFFAVLADQVPDRYVKVVKMAGFDEGKVDGFALLQSSYRQFSRSNDIASAESGILWVLCLWEFDKNKDEVWEAWESLNQNPAINKLLLTQYVGLLSGFKTGRLAGVKDILDDMEKNDWMKRIPYAYYQRGKYKLYSNQASCIDDFKTFVDQATGSNFVKSAWMQMGFYWMINGSESNAEFCFKQAENEGIDLHWTDKQVLNELRERERSDPLLLKLQVLYDGASYQACLDSSLEILSLDLDRSEAFFAELFYRKARSLEALQKHNEALEVYQYLLSNYDQVETYHIPKSALHAAEICVSQGADEQALRFLDQGERTNNYGYQKALKRQMQSLRRSLID